MRICNRCDNVTRIGEGVRDVDQCANFAQVQILIYINEHRLVQKVIIIVFIYIITIKITL